MLTALCATAIVLGLLLGRRSSLLSLLLASPAIWLASALALLAAGKGFGLACLSALGPMAASQIAFFAGAQMRLEGQAAQQARTDGRPSGRIPTPAIRSRKVAAVRTLAADDGNEEA